MLDQLLHESILFTGWQMRLSTQ